MKRFYYKYKYWYDCVRPIKKIGNTIYRVSRKWDPKPSKEQCYGIARCIVENNADGMKDYLSYWEDGELVFPIPLSKKEQERQEQLNKELEEAEKSGCFEVVDEEE